MLQILRYILFSKPIIKLIKYLDIKQVLIVNKITQQLIIEEGIKYP